MTNPIHSFNINIIENMQKTNDNGGLIRIRRMNEPI